MMAQGSYSRVPTNWWIGIDGGWIILENLMNGWLDLFENLVNWEFIKSGINWESL